MLWCFQCQELKFHLPCCSTASLLSLPQGLAWLPQCYICTAAHKKGNTGEERSLKTRPFKDTSWKLHIQFLLPFPCPELANMATPHCKGIWEMQSLFWVAMCWVLIEKEERMPVGGPHSLSQKPVRLSSQSKHWAYDNTARVMETRAAGLVQSHGKK